MSEQTASPTRPSDADRTGAEAVGRLDAAIAMRGVVTREAAPRLGRRRRRRCARPVTIDAAASSLRRRRRPGCVGRPTASWRWATSRGRGAGDHVRRRRQRAASRARHAERYRGRASAISPPRSCATSGRRQTYPQLRDAQPARPRLRTSVPHQRRLRRLAGALHAPRRRGDPDTAPRAGRRTSPPACWCFLRSVRSRRVALTSWQPHLVVIVDDGDGLPRRCRDTYARCQDGLAECDYLPRESTPRPPFYVASAGEWKQPLSRLAARSGERRRSAAPRTLFDLRPVHGAGSLWQDCPRRRRRRRGPRLPARARQRLPGEPAAADVLPGRRGRAESASRRAVFRLEHSALRPLVDVGRVFGMAASNVLGTLHARALCDGADAAARARSIFREAAETLRIVLWQQGRVGISQGTAGAELPPALLSRHDRHVLKSGFPLHPAAARVHRPISAWLDDALMEPAVPRALPRVLRHHLDRRRRRSISVRFVVLDSETTGLNPAHRSHSSRSAPSPSARGEIVPRGLLRRAAPRRATTPRRSRCTASRATRAAEGSRSRKRWRVSSTTCGTA